LIRLAAYSGLRAGEIAGLRLRRLDLLGGRVEGAERLTDADGTLVSNATTKSGKVRTVPIPKFIADELAPLLARKTPEDYVFTSPEGGPLPHSNFYRRLFRPGVERAGLPDGIRFHDLRHTYAGFLIAEGAHPKAIMERMGHSSISVTLDRYGHLLPSLEEHLTNALDVSGRAAQQGSAPDRARIAPGGVSPLHRSTKKQPPTSSFVRARGRLRTDDLTLTRRLLWPTELLGQKMGFDLR
jgi:integrase